MLEHFPAYQGTAWERTRAAYSYKVSKSNFLNLKLITWQYKLSQRNGPILFRCMVKGTVSRDFLPLIFL
jgi:hypothetical protein